MDGLIVGMVVDFQLIYVDICIEQSYGYIFEFKVGLIFGQLDFVICFIDLLDEGFGFVVEEILLGCNVIVCWVIYFLLLLCKFKFMVLFDYLWIVLLLMSLLFVDFYSLLLLFGVMEVKICYFGGLLMSVVNYLKGLDVLIILFYFIVFLM